MNGPEYSRAYFNQEIFIAEMQSKREEKSLSLRATSAKTGISLATLSRLLNGDVPPMAQRPCEAERRGSA